MSEGVPSEPELDVVSSALEAFSDEEGSLEGTAGSCGISLPSSSFWYNRPLSPPIRRIYCCKSACGIFASKEKSFSAPSLYSLT